MSQTARVIAAAPALTAAVLQLVGEPLLSGTSGGLSPSAVAYAVLPFSLAPAALVWRGRLRALVAPALIVAGVAIASSLAWRVGFRLDPYGFTCCDNAAGTMYDTQLIATPLGLLLYALGLLKRGWPSPWSFVPLLAVLSPAVLFIPGMIVWIFVVLWLWLGVNSAVVGVGLLRTFP